MTLIQFERRLASVEKQLGKLQQSLDYSRAVEGIRRRPGISRSRPRYSCRQGVSPVAAKARPCRPTITNFGDELPRHHPATRQARYRCGVHLSGTTFSPSRGTMARRHRRCNSFAGQVSQTMRAGTRKSRVSGRDQATDIWPSRRQVQGAVRHSWQNGARVACAHTVHDKRCRAMRFKSKDVPCST